MRRVQEGRGAVDDEACKPFVQVEESHCTLLRGSACALGECSGADGRRNRLCRGGHAGRRFRRSDIEGEGLVARTIVGVREAHARSDDRGGVTRVDRTFGEGREGAGELGGQEEGIRDARLHRAVGDPHCSTELERHLAKGEIRA